MDDLADLRSEVEEEKGKQRTYYRQWYNKNGKQRKRLSRKQRSKSVQQLRLRKKIELITLAGGVCSDCGGSYQPNQYDFHHLDPSIKEESLHLDWTMEKLIEELKKCILLCANCHRLRHTNNH